MADIKNLIILGGTGFIGTHVTHYFSKKKFKVFCIGRSKLKNKLPDVNYFFLDLYKIKRSHKIFKIDNACIINLTGYVDHTVLSKNSEDLLSSHLYSVIRFCSFLDRKKNYKIINIGSSEEYGFQKSPLKEIYRESPSSLYSFLKTSLTHFFQMIHRSLSIPTITLRLFLIYGPNQKENRLIPYIIKKLLRNENVIINSNGLQKKDFLYIDDLLAIIEKIIKINYFNGEIINVGSGKIITVKKIVNLIHNKIKKGKVSFAKNGRESENLIQYPSINKLKSFYDLNSFTKIETGIKKTIDFYSN